MKYLNTFESFLNEGTLLPSTDSHIPHELGLIMLKHLVSSNKSLREGVQEAVWFTTDEAREITREYGENWHLSGHSAETILKSATRLTVFVIDRDLDKGHAYIEIYPKTGPAMKFDLKVRKFDQISSYTKYSAVTATWKELGEFLKSEEPSPYVKYFLEKGWSYDEFQKNYRGGIAAKDYNV